jgi:hypothetical protein
MQLGVQRPGGKAEINGAAFWVEAPGDRDRFQKSGFTAAVLANDERHIGVELEAVELPNGRNAKRVASCGRTPPPS